MPRGSVILSGLSDRASDVDRFDTSANSEGSIIYNVLKNITFIVSACFLRGVQVVANSRDQLTVPGLIDRSIRYEESP